MTVSESFDEKDVLTWQDDTFYEFYDETIGSLSFYMMILF